jgi:hypothetical protein
MASKRRKVLIKKLFTLETQASDKPINNVAISSNLITSNPTSGVICRESE